MQPRKEGNWLSLITLWPWFWRSKKSRFHLYLCRRTVISDFEEWDLIDCRLFVKVTCSDRDCGHTCHGSTFGDFLLSYGGVPWKYLSLTVCQHMFFQESLHIGRVKNWWIYWLCPSFIFPYLINWQLKQLLLIGAVYHMFNLFLQFSYLILTNLCTLWESSLVYLWVTLSILCIYKFCVKLSASSFGWQ